jgi:hypothetical protein
MRAPGAAGVVVGVLACLFIGCAGSGGDGGGGGGNKPPACASQVPGDPISYPSNIAPILAQSCGLSGCHVPPIVNAGLDLTPAKAYDQIYNVPASQVAGLKRIKPGDPDNSYLLRKITPDATIQGVLMPQGCPGTPVAGPRCLLPDEIDAFRTWILECAPRN